MELYSASIDITYDCNFRCRHCFNSSGEHTTTKEKLSDEEILKVTNQLFDLGTKTICLCGGETMLRKELIYKIAALKEEVAPKCSISMVSNGYLIDSNTVDKLVDSGINHVQISVDGFKESHEWLRNKKGSYEKAIAAIKMLITRGMDVGIAFVPNKRNCHEFGEIIDYMFQLGAKEVRTQPLMMLGRSREYLKDYILSDMDYMKIKHTINKKLLQYSDSDFRLEWGDPLAHLYNDPLNYNSHLIINAYGELLVSPYLPISVGNVRSGNLRNYLELGLNKIGDTEIIKEIVQHIDSASNMDMSRYGLPEIFTDNIDLDIMNENWMQKAEEVIKVLKTKG